VKEWQKINEFIKYSFRIRIFIGKLLDWMERLGYNAYPKTVIINTKLDFRCARILLFSR